MASIVAEAMYSSTPVPGIQSLMKARLSSARSNRNFGEARLGQHPLELAPLVQRRRRSQSAPPRSRETAPGSAR